MPDHFEILGLPQQITLEEADIERAYLARSRAIHPDFHQLGSTAERAASVQLSAALNEAYTTLKDPFIRANYLLQLEGGPTASEVKDIPPEFLEEMLELRMQIAELEPDSPESEAMERDLIRRQDDLLAQVRTLFESGLSSNKENGLRRIRQLLNAAKYVRNLLRDLRSH